MLRFRLFCLLCLAAACAQVRPVPSPPPPSGPSLAFTHVRVFDGEKAWPSATVIVRGGVIAEMGPTAVPDASAQVIDGQGDTLLPGLIDAHAHVWDASHLEQAAVFGVTTVLDMGCNDPKVGRELRAQAAAPGSTLADLRFAGYAVTVKGGHCTEYGFPVPTVETTADVDAFVAARVAEGSDYIKIIYDDVHWLGLHRPTISKEMLGAAIAAAHAHHKMALVHIGSAQDARDAIELGADGLAHLFVDRDPDPDFGSLLASHHAFAVPTLSVLRTIVGDSVGPGIAADPQLSPYLGPDAMSGLGQTFPMPPAHLTYSSAVAAVTALRRASVPVLAGTDAPNPGTTWGASTHGELELLVGAGMTPSEALSAATSAAADRFGLADRGRIAEGKRADLLLVRGDPTADIRATRDIAGVWRGGVPVDRAAFAKEVADAKTHTATLDLGDGLISDFEDLKTTTRFGSGWRVSTDAIAGGTSTAEVAAIDGGANGSKGSLLITGEVKPGSPFPWAGTIFFPGAQNMEPVDLSAKKGIRFQARGDGATYQVLIFTRSHGFIPLRKTFVAGADWGAHELGFADFDGIDAHDLVGIAFVGGPAPGKIRLQLDDVRLW